MPKKLEYRASEPFVLTEQEIQDSVKAVVNRMSEARYKEFWEGMENVRGSEHTAGVA